MARDESCRSLLDLTRLEEARLLRALGRELADCGPKDRQPLENLIARIRAAADKVSAARRRADERTVCES